MPAFPLGPRDRGQQLSLLKIHKGGNQQPHSPWPHAGGNRGDEGGDHHGPPAGRPAINSGDVSDFLKNVLKEEKAPPRPAQDKAGAGTGSITMRAPLPHQAANHANYCD